MVTANLQICLVDDDRIYQFAARKTIEATGLVSSIKSFQNGQEAIRFLENCTEADTQSLPDVIFLDINMPVMNGWQFLDAFSTIRAKLPKPITIYMVSSSVDEFDINKSKQYKEVKAYIIKPVHKEKFKQLLNLQVA
ncbi:MAG: response regulator [Bacteroidetes bacterium]|nr:MAG: response regulator [Bacteroidota bacterium]TAE70088.1 MAG: response regulator [Bacteroidota bacterium]TAF91659.1 MAG: response regulator [Bacteroidota bacterium]